jgi:hypothetical protein
VLKVAVAPRAASLNDAAIKASAAATNIPRPLGNRRWGSDRREDPEKSKRAFID